MALIEGIQFLDRLGFPDIVLWLLSFALVYGILGQVKIPKSNIARAIIALVAAFFVLMSAPAQLISVLSSMSTGLVVIIMGLLVFIVFLEAAGVKLGKVEKSRTEKGVELKQEVHYRVFEKHSKEFTALLIIFALVVFIAAGGMNLLGFNLILNSSSTMTLFVIGVIILAVFWLISEKPKEE